MSRTGLKAALAVFKIAVSAALLIYLFRRADAGTMLVRFREMNLVWTMAALATYGLMLAVSAWRWRLLLRIQVIDVPLRTLTRSFLVATFFNNFLPSNIGGDVVRVADTASAAGSKTMATAVVLLDRILGLVALLAVAATASTAATAVGVPLTGTGYVWIALIALVAGLIVGFSRPDLVSRFIRWAGSKSGESLRVRFQNLALAIDRFGGEPRGIWQAFAGAIAVQLLLVVFYIFTARSLAVPLPALAASVIVPVSLAVQMVPVSINGFGVREAVFAFFFTSLGLNVSSALTLSLGSAGLIMLFSLSGGAVFLVRYRGRLAAPPRTRAIVEQT